MAMKHVPDGTVCLAVLAYRFLCLRQEQAMHSVPPWDRPSIPFPYDILVAMTGQPWKVCYRAMERAHRRGFIEYGVSLRTGWLTDAGKALIHIK